MPNPKKTPKNNTSVSLTNEAKSILAQLAKKFDRSGSYLINTLILKEGEIHGIKPTLDPSPPKPSTSSS